ncbi:hypothetical protein [Paraflavitalea sp. CAU 1676]|uniref:hypothetical protein n=1 Tax=Paraflavitalea sp. CAU 1676 TaxID=3032598 RepID=UPI0023DA950D|nr:hypothetical protein [Paraflavitalea sp. CAU 1676]MDF2193313.1 hypothetical protein [Paraflavitalea sp. CAU 1676]
MALNIKIDLENRYELKAKDNNLHYNMFSCPQSNGGISQIAVKISDEEHPFLPEVYNLAFGPVDDKNEINAPTRDEHTCTTGAS